MKVLMIAASAFMLAGCPGTLERFSYSSMNAEQIAAAVKDKNSAAQCVEFTGTGGQFRTLSLSNDGGVIKSGTATLECGSNKATFTNGEKK